MLVKFCNKSSPSMLPRYSYQTGFSVIASFCCMGSSLFILLKQVTAGAIHPSLPQSSNASCFSRRGGAQRGAQSGSVSEQAQHLGEGDEPVLVGMTMALPSLSPGPEVT